MDVKITYFPVIFLIAPNIQSHPFMSNYQENFFIWKVMKKHKNLEQIRGTLLLAFINAQLRNNF